MAHAISIDGSEISATQNPRLEALKTRYVPTSNNQQPAGDGDLNKIMDPDLYEATKEGDVEKFVDVLEKVSESRKLALLQIFNQVTPSGNSLLHVAASSGREHLVRHIVDLVTKRNSSEDTSLHVTVQERTNKTEKLIRQGPDSGIIYRKNKDSKSPLYLAAETGDMKILKPLLEASAQDEDYASRIEGMSPVFATLQKSNLDILREIIDRLPKLLHVRGEDGGTPLHSAASVGNLGAVELLLEKCPDLALQTDKNGSYPIHIACQEGDSALSIEKLIEHTWPDLAEIKNNKGQNILHVAAEAGNNDAVQCILKQCSEKCIEKLVNSKDVDGNTPLHLASMHNHCKVLLYLLNVKKIDLQLRNDHNLTARDVTMKSESTSTEYSTFLGNAILTLARVPQTKGRDVRSPREGGSWVKKEIDTQLVVATLVASVAFTAGIALPGGYNGSSDPNPGLATMMHNRDFQVFVIFDALATYFSILSVVILLWANSAITSEAEQYYNLAGPLLLWAVNFMTVAFSAALILAVRKVTWLATFLLSEAVIFLFYLGLLSFCLLESYAVYFPSFASPSFASRWYLRRIRREMG